MDRKHLAIALSKIPDPPDPQSVKEQVRTPGDLAADFLLLADEHGDLEDKNVVDLGAGTGVLGIGALLLGARRVLGVESDPALLPLAKEAAQKNRVEAAYQVLEAEVARIEPADLQQAMGADVDTVIMNPPFGADRSSRAAGGDRAFLSLAFRLAPRVYSMHLSATLRFLQAYAKDAGYHVEPLAEVPFPLPARFAHHRTERASRDVLFVRYTRQESQS